MSTRARPTTKADETPEFIAFWEIWRPFKSEFEGRGSARDEFTRHVERYRVDPQDIVDGARWHIRAGGNQKIGRDGLPVRQHAKSWLNTRAYEDDAESERAFQARLTAAPSNVTTIQPRKSQWLIEYEAQQKAKQG